MSALPPATDVYRLIDAHAGAPLPADDLVFLFAPLLRTIAGLHRHGRVAGSGTGAILRAADGRLHLRNPAGRLPELKPAAIKAIQPTLGSTLNIIGEHRLTIDAAVGADLEDVRTQDDRVADIDRPVYINGYQSWEQRLGHHDELTDVFLLGQLLASLACGLDFHDLADLRKFARSRDNLFQLNSRLNPVLARIILEMTALNRHDRATDLASLADRIESYREQPTGLDVERVLSAATGVASRRTAVLSHLRDRLFDLSRRNRLLHFRPTLASVNLTVASVPLVLQLQSIRSEQLCIWGDRFSSEILSGKQVNLQQWLRFEDQPYLPGSLDRIIQDTRRDRAEYGFSDLRLVVGFLRWNNLKDAPDERIVSPLLWLSAELVRKKGVRDQYLLQCESSEAEFNPALRHHLRQLYGIHLPEFVDLSTTTLAEIHADLSAQIKRTEPGVELRLLSQPAIELIHQKAIQRIAQFQRRRRRAEQRSTGTRPDFSYAADDYRPLGLALFRQKVMSSPLPLRSAVGAAPVPRPAEMVETTDSVENLSYALGGDRGHRYAWDLDLTQITLANFNYKKMSLVRDYAQLLEEGTANPALDRVFSIEPREVEPEAPPIIPLAEQWNVVAGDATQNAAVSLARSGRSFIIQGPPGTGKSQTITNLIADYTGRGKRVLFVCEKRAALDVVFHRLKQSGLAQLCCLIHDSQTDKKAFVAELRSCYEDWVSRADELDAHLQDRSTILQKLEVNLQRIAAFERAMSDRPESLACTVRALIRRAIELPAPAEVGHALRACVPELADWDRHRPLTDKVERHVQQQFGVDHLAMHPFSRLPASLVEGQHAYVEVQTLIDECEQILDSFDSAFEDPSRLLHAGQSIEEALTLAAACAQIVELKLADRLTLLENGSADAQAFAAERSRLDQLAQEQIRARSETTHWREPLAPGDTQSALELARASEPSVLRWLQPAWWRLRREIARRYDFSRHAVRPSLTQTLEKLAAEQQATLNLETATRDAANQFGSSDWSGFLRGFDALAHRCRSAPALSAACASLKAADNPAARNAIEASALSGLQRLAALAGDSLGLPGSTRLDDLAAWLRELRESLDDLPDFLPLLRQVNAAGASYANALKTLPLSGLALESLVVSEALARVMRLEPMLAEFDGKALSRDGKRVALGEKRLLDQNAVVVSATIHRNFLRNIRRSALSVSQLSNEDKEFKRRYSTGRRELEHEFGKTMRYRSIREFADGDSGLVINDLKPIWLMSPLSVSDTLPLLPDLFDVVIFDEASQIPMEEAVPALCRANQVVVVGDEMQLPPTTFFAARGDEDEDQLVVEDEGVRIAINLDADSLLAQAARNLPATLLAWHYRSRHEALISFSNAAFYDGRLVTIPDRKLQPSDRKILHLASDAPEAATAGAAAVRDCAISFHQISDGVYVDRRNVPEARYIARLVCELLGEDSGMSLGLVAFSEAQQAEIEEALEALAAEDSEFATCLEREYVREDDDQFNGLFVKNLENVQGDERDIILLSICYAPGPDGRMLMNFGPINQRGGEKRLNVIFSRARHRMAVISTIRSEAITNTHNDGAVALKAFLHYAEATAMGDGDRSQSILGALNPGAQKAFSSAPPKDAFRTALAAALRERGHRVDEHVGKSSFRCDLAIRSAAGGDYQLGILLDAAPAANTSPRERYVFRPTVLRAFGWRVLDLPSSEWLAHPNRVIARIEAELARADGTPDPDEDAHEYALQHSSATQPSGQPVDEPTTEPAEGFSEFVFQQGSSNKFWRIGCHGNDVTVVYGRFGSKGQSVIKTFETPERAAREVAKLILEKINKGYVEVSRPTS
ncbi:MAG: AAA domain-containing protein [Lysobacterales bacterium]